MIVRPCGYLQSYDCMIMQQLTMTAVRLSRQLQYLWLWWNGVRHMILHKRVNHQPDLRIAATCLRMACLKATFVSGCDNLHDRVGLAADAVLASCKQGMCWTWAHMAYGPIHACHRVLLLAPLCQVCCF